MLLQLLYAYTNVCLFNACHSYAAHSGLLILTTLSQTQMKVDTGFVL